MRISPAFLHRIPIFRGLSAASLGGLLRRAEIRELGPRAAIFAKGEPAKEMYVVVSGRVKIFSRSGTRSKTISYLGAGEVFGEMALVDDQARSASAQAVEPSTLLVVGKAEFRRLLAREPSVAGHLIRLLTRRLRAANLEIDSLLFGNMLGRLAKVLCDLGQAGKLEARRYSHQELADVIGTTRLPLLRAMVRFRDAGFIDYRDGRIVLKEPRRLAALAL